MSGAGGAGRYSAKVASRVRKELEGEGGVIRKPPDLLVVSEVLRTKSVRVELQQKASGAGKLIVEFADSAARDAVIEGIKGAVDA